jgi:hypothetical protein
VAFSAERHRYDRTPRSGRRTPGPLPAFDARTAARRSKQIAICATARKPAVLAWHLLSKDEDYRYGAPTITQRKLRNLKRKAADTGPRISLAGETKRKTLERRFLEEAERNYRNYVATKTARGAGAATGTRLFRPSMRQATRGGLHSPRMPALLVRGQPRQEELSHPALDVFIRMGAVG